MYQIDLKQYQDSSEVPLLELPVAVRLSFWPFRIAVASSVDVHDGILTLTFASWASPCMYDSMNAEYKVDTSLILESNNAV